VTDDQLPTLHCWRCESVCDVAWVDVSTFASSEPEVMLGEVRCTNTQCKGQFDRSAHIPPSPETLVRRGEEVLQRIRDIAVEGA
jgi:hypothetical protein